MLLVSRYKPDGVYGGNTEGFDLTFQIKSDGSAITSGQAVVVGFTLPNASAPVVGIDAHLSGGGSPVALAEDMNTAGAPGGASTLRLWSRRNLTNGETHVTVRLTADTFLEPVIYVFSGMAATSHTGTVATDEGSTFVEGQPTVDVATDSANEAIIALIELTVGDALTTPTTGFTLLPGGATESSFHAMDDDDVGVAGSRAVGASGYSGGWRISALPYKNASGGSSNTNLTVDHAQMAATGQDITLTASASGTLPVDHGQAAGQGQDIALTASAAVTLVLDHAQMAAQGYDIPFILTQPGTTAQVAVEGQNIGLLAANSYALAVDVGSAAGQGQDITLAASASYNLLLEMAQMAFAGSNVVLSYSGVTISPNPRWFPLPLGEKLSWLRRYTGLHDAALAEASGSALWARFQLYQNVEIDVHSVPGYPRPNYTH